VAQLAGRFPVDVERRFDALKAEHGGAKATRPTSCAQQRRLVKVRAGLVDVKTKVEVSDDGLERWKPIPQGAYPLPAVAVGELMQALGVRGPASSARGEHPRTNSSTSWSAPTPSCSRPRPQEQRITSFDGCMAERSEVRSEHGAQLTIAVDSEDGDLVRATVRELGFDVLANISPAARVKVLAGIG